MRTPRIAILVLFLAAFLFILYRAFTVNPRLKTTTPFPRESRPSRSLFGFMFYNTPFTLFPPNAAISLTDDNSTSFAARPAAFGPKLVSSGLSGQLWVGSGFGEDSLESDGELGCSDLPSWGTGQTRASLKTSYRVGDSAATSTRAKVPVRRGGVADADEQEAAPVKAQSKSSKNDNTDDYLNESGVSSSHADIQSIQEAAEIEGKVVLLKRGGCGFLEKVMWAQRRGAVAVIVGDNQKGGPLIQMFAHGEEVENVTVPSVFTARTTAQLLSALTQPGSFVEDFLDDSGKSALRVQPPSAPKQDPSKRSKADAPKRALAKRGTQGSTTPVPTERRGLFASLFGRVGASPRNNENRPPRSGRLEWIMVGDWSDENDQVLKDRMGKNKKSKKSVKPTDDFVIGVNDWRDPDLVGKSEDGKISGIHKTMSKSDRPSKGGSANSGSGEYAREKAALSAKNGRVTGSTVSDREYNAKGSGSASKAFGDRHADLSRPKPELPPSGDGTYPFLPPPPIEMAPRKGLWVTITPTSSASPFFDTLLVLVISPLVTLTVVYALLILRARIRRRRWRAPKSVVEQLPVRTYHTVAASPTLSPMASSPATATPTTPLLQHGPVAPRPRSRTTTGVMETENLHTPSAAMPTPQSPSGSRRNDVEKGAGGLSAEWRKYMGRQVECVVCLEEYVDGVSRVMSLPCGHEFHADCM